MAGDWEEITGDRLKIWRCTGDRWRSARDRRRSARDRWRSIANQQHVCSVVPGILCHTRKFQIVLKVPETFSNFRRDLDGSPIILADAFNYKIIIETDINQPSTTVIVQLR
mmetsp:Transcript_20305/g.32177  ORF Transcript_20305/g.32177 Transcript_20305/m.32177 type:complete len:111 (-) Transcript_20305:358-690(-)